MRSRYYTIWNNEEQVDLNFGSISLAVYYINLMDVNKSKLFLALLGNESHYRYVMGLSTVGYDTDALFAYFNINDYQEITQFIDNQVVPSLNALGDKDLLEAYGGRDKFNELVSSDLSSHLSLLGINKFESEGGLFEARDIAIYCQIISDFMKDAVTNNEPYSIDCA